MLNSAPCYKIKDSCLGEDKSVCLVVGANVEVDKGFFYCVESFSWNSER